jgi:methyl-accepting chemotaxis protein
MDFEQAMMKHAEWKSKLRTALYGKEQLDPAAVSKDNLCEFGKWLYGEAMHLHASKPAFRKCVEEHAAFHREAGRVAVAIQEKRIEEAEKMLAPGSDYSEVSKRVGIAIQELKKQA